MVLSLEKGEPKPLSLAKVRGSEKQEVGNDEKVGVLCGVMARKGEKAERLQVAPWGSNSLSAQRLTEL